MLFINYVESTPQTRKPLEIFYFLLQLSRILVLQFVLPYLMEWLESRWFWVKRDVWIASIVSKPQQRFFARFLALVLVSDNTVSFSTTTFENTFGVVD